MTSMGSRPRRAGGSTVSEEDRKQVLERARQREDEQLRGYREQSLRIHPWICARCGREFTQRNLHELTVHHKDHDHTNNPPDGSNWENLCIYCHDQEHTKYLEHASRGGGPDSRKAADRNRATHKPFAALGDLLKNSGRE